MSELLGFVVGLIATIVVVTMPLWLPRHDDKDKKRAFERGADCPCRRTPMGWDGGDCDLHRINPVGMPGRDGGNTGTDGVAVDARGVIVGIADQPLANAASVLAEFAKTAPGRLPQRVQDAIAVVDGVTGATAPEPERDWCTDPNNCKRCKAPTWDQLRHDHAGIPQGRQRTSGPSEPREQTLR